ncbi:MAG: hypothetical protein KJ620_03935 [Candidatus Edwardsbacteria bacterium]|nr:hypothetical protein [Candidatus Edwardsbacteria bacterium]MBU1577765.1 hypothetical protein [Candidatus Edwardsbacteria bacterium]MBU2464596.1 hypothetical protein [Candidatus Edwardsbacteria bacterium]MBU2595030.1 hypothetical protein [Candidatus Edwardsbacteria bacterium]
MVIIELTKGHVKAIMYDGFIPDKTILLSSIKQLDLAKAISKDELSDILHGLRSLCPDNNSYYYFYNKLQYYVMTRMNCPMRNSKIPFYTALGNKTGKLNCFSQYYTIGTNRHSLELKSQKHLKYLDSLTIYSSLCKEYQQIHKKKPKDLYIQNVILHTFDSLPCGKDPRECLDNVVDILGFMIRKEDSCLNANDFKYDWHLLLNNIIEKYHNLYFPS